MPDVSRMTVLMTTDTVGGVWDYSIELCRNLAPLGIRTILASMGQMPTPDQRASACEVPGLTLQTSTFKLEWMPGSDKDVHSAGEWLLSLERRYMPDVVHINGYAHAALPWKAPCLAVAHSCVLSWWIFVKGGPAPREWMPYAERVEKGLQAADLVIAPTRSLLQIIRNIYGFLQEIWVIHNGRSPDWFLPAPKEDLIFSAGRIWDDAKNIAALEAVSPNLEWPVLVAGDCGSDFSGKDSPNLRYAGFLPPDAMRRKLAVAKIYALPARYEPFGLSILEAALSECALVLGDIPFLRELWEGIAVFVPPDDHVRLEKALQSLACDQKLIRRMGRAARHRGKRLTSSRMARGYVSAYLHVLDRKETSRSPAVSAVRSYSQV